MATLHQSMLVAACLCAALSGAAAPADGWPVPTQEARTMQGVRLVYRFPAPSIHATADGYAVGISGCEADEQAGSPVLPVCGVDIAVPAGKTVAYVRVTPLETTAIALDGPVRSGEYALPLSTDSRMVARAKPNREIYRSRRPFPSHDTPRFRVDRQRGSERLALALQPVQVIPAENRLLVHGALVVDVGWTDAQEPDAMGGAKPGSPVVSRADGALPLGGATTSAPVAVPLLQGPETDAKLPPGTNEYVIVGDAALMANTPPPWNFAALLSSRRTAGLTATNVSVAWIATTYTGKDTPAKIRAFVRDAYQTWGTRFILLAGTHALVPARQLYCAFTSGTTVYSAYIPSDSLYYGCLDGDFNYDGDALYGEPTDGVAGGDVDLLAEVSVGRFPIASTNEAALLIRKTLLYESAPASSLTRVSHVGEYLGFGGPADYATGMMEEVRLGSSVPDYTTLGFENPEYGGLFDTSNTLYDAPTYTWPASQIISRLNGNYHVFNHMGHGAAWVCFKLNLSLAADKLAVANLTNSVYYLSYSQACEPGRFDDRTDCFAEQLVTSRAGAFAAVMNPRYGWGFQNSVDGPSQRFHRRFWDAVFARGRYHLGVMNQDSKERNRYLVNTVGSGDPMRWCYYEITLFGDPATPFAARILKFAPTFVHTPLNNQYTTQGVYRIDCTMGPVGLYEPTSPRVVWQSSGSPGTVHTNLLSRCSGSRYEGAIPAQPTGARISYRLLADTLAGEAGQWPASGDHLFDVTPPVSLTVQGQPAPYGVVTPAYGTSLIASGTVISAAAPVRLETAPGVSQAQAGWTGSGCVPATGTSNQVSFALTVPSTLNWQWTTEFALQQRSSLAGLIASNSWHRPGTIADSMIAPATISQSGKTYAFCGWYLDGLRQPTAPSPVINPVAGVVLSTNRLLSALYVTTIQDLDGNGIPDWWEYSFFGTNGVPPATDIDGDGFGAGDEYRDRTNPTDQSSRPAPPAILLSPLASPQAMPPPYAVSVTLTDSYAIASATLRWRRNGGTWQSAALASRGSGVYTGTIPAPGVPADVFDYNLIATDPAGHAATTAVYSVWLQYPRVAFGPAQGRDLVLLPSGVDYALLAITNTGNARLNWSLARGSHEVVTPGASGWRTNAYGQVWRASSTRSFSPPYAFSAHLTSGGSQNFTPPVHACLESPALQLASRARLFFRHWVKTELDSVAGYCYDGGVVEISTNAGVSFVQLPGPYTHKIHGWTYSPWLNDTPCFAGNGSAGWVEVSFDLAAYAGQTVLLRFHYGADNNTDDEGWYVDDIRVGPLSSPIWPDWAVCGATAGSLVGGGKVTFPFDTDASLAVLRDDRLAVHLLSNDPVTPNVYVDWTLKIREPPLIDGPWAWQSSTNGEGLVTLRLNVADRDGEAVDLQVDCSTNAGATWFAPTLTGTSVSLGQAPAGVVTGQIAHLVTTDAGGMRSNVVSTVWPTRIPMPGIALAPAARMRVRGSNPYFASDYRTSAAFVIDNQQPTQPTGLLLSHTPQTWTPATAFSASWEPASDGAGIGGLRYRRRLAADTAAPAAPSQAALTFSGVVPEGSNTWFAVQAVDAFGNAGAIVRRGPFWVDATPPASASARAWVASSDAGPYAVGTNVLFSWEGFGDALSGIAGYRAHNVAAPVASETTATHLVLPAQPVGVTNGFGVAAFDRAGNVSPWVLAHVLVLDPLADPDGDGMLTRDEEVAGTDARAADQLFMIGMSTDLGTLVVQWTGRSGRTYTVDRTPTLAPVDWSPVPAHTGIPGSNGLMRAIVPRDLTVGFFRVRVSR